MDIDIWQAALLGLIQGFAEWFPVSSSGHLVLVQNTMNLHVPIVFDVLLHVASLLSLVICFWKEIIEIIKGVFRKDPAHLRFVVRLLIASIPVAVIGVLLEDAIEAAFSNLVATGLSFLVTGAWLLVSVWPREKQREMTYRSTFVIGCAQAIALLPGISRSGSTNATAQIQGIKPEVSSKFCFLLAIPAILGALIFKVDEIGSITDFPPLIIAFGITFVVGIVALKLVVKLFNKQRLWYFTPYCVAIGVITLILAGV